MFANHIFLNKIIDRYLNIPFVDRLNSPLELKLFLGPLHARLYFATLIGEGKDEGWVPSFFGIKRFVNRFMCLGIPTHFLDPLLQVPRKWNSVPKID